MTNFRLYQFEKVCRRQFDENGQMGRKHSGKRKSSLRAFLFFAQCFQKTCTADT